MTDVDNAIRRGGPHTPITSVSLEEYEAALKCVEFWKIRAKIAEGELLRVTKAAIEKENLR